MGKTFKKSNQLIHAYNSGCLLANQLFAIGMQNIFIDENNRVVSTMYEEDIKEGLNLSSDSVYKSISELCNKDTTASSIYEWKIMYKDSKTGKMMEHAMVSAASFQNRTLKITYNDTVTDLILNLKKNATLLDFSESMSFETNCSYRLYELIKAEYALKTKELKKSGEISADYNLIELKLMLGDIDYKVVPMISEELEKKSPDYKRIEDIVNSTGFDIHKEYSYFNEEILSGAVRELNEKTSLKVEYVPIDDGRTVTGVRFLIS